MNGRTARERGKGFDLRSQVRICESMRGIRSRQPHEAQHTGEVEKRIQTSITERGIIHNIVLERRRFPALMQPWLTSGLGPALGWGGVSHATAVPFPRALSYAPGSGSREPG